MTIKVLLFLEHIIEQIERLLSIPEFSKHRLVNRTVFIIPLWIPDEGRFDERNMRFSTLVLEDSKYSKTRNFKYFDKVLGADC
jgi:hypothetical protein